MTALGLAQEWLRSVGCSSWADTDCKERRTLESLLNYNEQLEAVILRANRLEGVLRDIAEAESPFGCRPGTEKVFLKELHARAREALK